MAIQLAATWSSKAKTWIEGRRNLFQELKSQISAGDRVIWMHCSSAGEFEQGKPVLERLKDTYPNHKIVVSFFSPSGYSVGRNYAYADHITYLPLDTPSNAKTFLDILQPKLVIFVKYEFWYHHLAAAAYRHVPILLISASFRHNQIFFKDYGGFFRQILFLFRHIFVQDKDSLNLLKSANISHATIGGDTRFDRVAKIASQSAAIPAVEAFLQNHQTLVAGSTWQKDEELLSVLYSNERQFHRLIIAPHEINKNRLAELHDAFTDSVFYSEWAALPTDEKKFKALIINNVGMLSRLYSYATIVYVGGGFTRDGIHNILEAAVWGKPVIFGPNYQKYREAVELIREGGAFSVTTSDELKQLADRLFNDEEFRQAAGNKARNYVMANTGATDRIINYIQANRLLTN